MTRSKNRMALLVAGGVMLAFAGCHTTVVQPVERPDHQQDQHDDHHDDRNQPPPPPDHRNDQR